MLLDKLLASFLINTTVGVLGIGNPAAKMGLKNQQEDIGQTLGAYGFKGDVTMCYRFWDQRT